MRRGLQASLVILMLLAPSLGAAQEGAASPDAASFPSHDSHQGVTIAAVPVPDTSEAERIFGPRAAPTRGGFLPVEVIVTNQRAEIIRVEMGRLKVLTEGDQFEQVSPAEVALGLYPRPEAKQPSTGPKPRLPIPWPRGQKKPKDKKRAKREEAEAALRSRQLRAAMVAPGGYARGYVYFDLRGRSIDLARSSLFVPEVNEEATGERLLFFEISLEPYAETKR